MLGAHLYVVSFATNDLNMSIISTMFNDFECMLWKADQDIKNIKLVRFHDWLWATAYLDMANVFSSHDFCSHRLFKVIKRVAIRPKNKTIHLLVSEIVPCTMPYAVRRWKTRRLARSIFTSSLRLMEFPSSSVSSNSTSYRLLNYWIKIPCLKNSG